MSETPLPQCGKVGVGHYVLCASFAPDYATTRDDFSAVMLLPDGEKPTGGKVDEGHRWASGAEDGTGRARLGGTAPEGGHRGERAGRGRGEQGSPSRDDPTGRDHRGSAPRSGRSSHGRPTEPHRPSNCHPPHPSHPLPFAGGHTFILKYPLSKIFWGKSKPSTVLFNTPPVIFNKGWRY